LTHDNWKQELERVLADLGPLWRVNTAWVEQSTPMCGAKVADAAGLERVVALARDRFATETARRVEIVRQLRRV
jgi:hypothetical protein